jgi:hypothetical protein
MTWKRNDFDPLVTGMLVLGLTKTHCEEVQMRALFFVGIVVLSGCALFRPDYYEGTCVNAEGKEIMRYMYPVTTGETSTTPACDDRRQITVKKEE